MSSRFFIERPRLSIVISALIALGGILSIPFLPVQEYPEITPPEVSVSTTYPGASAEVLEKTVAAPIEAAVNGADDMIYMSSTSSNARRVLSISSRIWSWLMKIGVPPPQWSCSTRRPAPNKARCISSSRETRSR